MIYKIAVFDQDRLTGVSYEDHLDMAISRARMLPDEYHVKVFQSYEVGREDVLVWEKLECHELIEEGISG